MHKSNVYPNEIHMVSLPQHLFQQNWDFVRKYNSELISNSSSPLYAALKTHWCSYMKWEQLQYFENYDTVSWSEKWASKV